MTLVRAKAGPAAPARAEDEKPCLSPELASGNMVRPLVAVHRRQPWHGKIGEVRIYTRAWSGGLFQADMKSRRTGALEPVFGLQRELGSGDRRRMACWSSRWAWRRFSSSRLSTWVLPLPSARATLTLPDFQ